MDFKYSIEDYKNIPGLYRSWDGNNPALVPVFFSKECLINFFYNSQYSCNLCSETYGSISDNNFNISFGINKNDKVIFWLCDLKDLPGKERKMLLPFNLDSDHDINSEFYDAQINCVFTENISEVQLLLEKSKINEKFGFSIFKEEKKDIDNLIKKCGQYKKIMFNGEKDFKWIISELSEELVESIDSASLINKMEFDNKDKLGSLKLFEKYIKDVCKIKDNLLNSYFILYDLRIWSDHKDGDDKFNASIRRLGIKNISYKNMYDVLIKELSVTHKALLSL
jgi:hypothetical protein